MLLAGFDQQLENSRGGTNKVVSVGINGPPDNGTDDNGVTQITE